MEYEKYYSWVLDVSSKKRILSLDGGGIRGLLTIQMLKKIEEIIQQKLGNPKALIRDYFHLIGGTSTGAIIAAALVKGLTAVEIEELYLTMGDKIFKPSFFRKGLFRSKFPTKPIYKSLFEQFRDMTMESTTEQGVGLAIVTKRLDTGSVWVLDNNPVGPYFKPKNSTFPNKDYVLREVIRASSAAPHYFDPELIEIASGQTGLFIDGGVSPHNNPALQLFMLATIKGYNYNFRTGAENLFILSLGTGSWVESIEDVIDNKKDMSAKRAIQALGSLMGDSAELNELLMQWMSNNKGPTKTIDKIVGTLESETLCKEALFSYVRYDPILEKEWLSSELGITKLSNKNIRMLREMDSTEMITHLIQIGNKMASEKIKAEHIF